MTQSKKSLNPLAILLILSAGFFLIFLLVSGVFFLKSAPTGSPGNLSSVSFFGGEAVGVIELNGVILDSKKTLKRLERFEQDDRIKSVVLRLNSPGGAVAPSQEIYQAVKEYQKPVVVSMGSVAASGAYYISCGASKVFANPGTLTGSIGVIMEFANLEKLYDWAKVERYAIKSGKFKDTGSEYRAMTPEEKALFQAMVNDILRQFKEAVITGRGLTEDQVSKIADGRVFSGYQAYEAHLVDELGSLHDAVVEAGKLGGIKGKPTVVYSEKQKKWWDLLLEDPSEQEGSSSLLGSSLSHFWPKKLDGESDMASKFLFRFISMVIGANGGMNSLSSPQRQPGLYWIWSQ